MRKHYTTAFKAKLVLELLKETKSLSQLAAEHKVHPVLLQTELEFGGFWLRHSSP